VQPPGVKQKKLTARPAAAAAAGSVPANNDVSRATAAKLEEDKEEDYLSTARLGKCMSVDKSCIFRSSPQKLKLERR